MWRGLVLEPIPFANAIQRLDAHNCPHRPEILQSMLIEQE